MEWFSGAEIFQLNSKVEVTEVIVGREESKVLMVDNFYRNPELVRKFILSCPAELFKWRKGTRNGLDFVDGRITYKVTAGIESPINAISYLAKAHYGHEAWMARELKANVFQLLGEQPRGSNAYPHHDQGILGAPDKVTEAELVASRLTAVLYLNLPEECKGGTGLYRNKQTGAETVPRTRIGYEEVVEKCLAREGVYDQGDYWCRRMDEYWEMYYLIPMAFNRLVIYPSRAFHAAYHEDGWFRDTRRINQVFFADMSLPPGHLRGASL